MTQTESPKFSFSGWNLWQFVKGRKRSVVTLAAVVIGYVIADSEVAAVVAGGLVEAVFGVLEYYVRER